MIPLAGSLTQLKLWRLLESCCIPLLLLLCLLWWVLRELRRSETGLLWRGEHRLTGKWLRVWTRLHSTLNGLCCKRRCRAGCATITDVVVHGGWSLQLLACEVRRGGTRGQCGRRGSHLDWGMQYRPISSSCWHCRWSLERGGIVLRGLGEVLVRGRVRWRKVSEVLEWVGGRGGNGRGSELVGCVVCCVTGYGRDRSISYCSISLIQNASVRVPCKGKRTVTFLDSYMSYRHWKSVLTVSEKSLCFSVYWWHLAQLITLKIIIIVLVCS